MTARRNPGVIASAHPETIMTGLLQDTLTATRHALAIAHPEIGDDDFDLRDIDQASRLAFILALSLVELDHLIEHYHRVVRNQYHAAQIAQLDLPF